MILNDFLTQVDYVSKYIKDIQLATEEINRTKEELDYLTIIKQTNQQILLCKKILQQLNAEINLVDNNLSISEQRIKKNVLSTFSRKFVDVLKEYQLSKQNYSTNKKNKIKRLITILDPNISPSNLENIFASNKVDEILKTAILSDGTNLNQVNVVQQDVFNTYQSLLVLDASIAELHQIFIDFAVIIEQQGTLLDQIEEQMKYTTDYIEEGNVNLSQSINYQKKIRGKQCFLFFILLVIVSIIIIIKYI